MLRLFVITICLILSIPFFFPRRSPQERLELLMIKMQQESDETLIRTQALRDAVKKIDQDIERMGLNE